MVAKKNEWKEVTTKMKVRRGHGTWWQVIVEKPDGTQKYLIMREVSKFRELGEKKSESPFEEVK